MRILMLVHSLRRGGAERILLELSLGLKRRGHEVEVAAWIDIDEYDDSCYREVGRHYLLPSREYRWIRSIPKSARVLRDLASQFKPDVIEIHSPNVAWLAAWAKMGIPCVHVLHGYENITRRGDIVSLVKRQGHILSARRMETTLVTVSDSMRAIAAKFFVINESKIHAVPNGIHLGRFPFRRDKPGDCFNILMLGELCPSKGQRLGVLAFRKLIEKVPSAKLMIVGEGEDRVVLEKLISELGIEKFVHLAGRRDDIPAIFATAHLLWHLSEREAMPMVILEAMAAGVPVVGFDVRGTRDAVAKGVTGCLVPYKDIKRVVEKSVGLLSNMSDYRTLAEKGRQRVERMFAHDSMVEGHERVLLSKM